VWARQALRLSLVFLLRMQAPPLAIRWCAAFLHVLGTTLPRRKIARPVPYPATAAQVARSFRDRVLRFVSTIGCTCRT
jgi:hypothetical protein